MSTQQTPNPKLFVQMSGAPGAGKSTVAGLLAPSVGAVVIDHDVIRSSLLDSNVTFEEAAKHAYRLQWTLADVLMRQGFSVVIDSTCNFPEVLERGSSCARAHGYAYWYVDTLGMTGVGWL
jgi:predicted kinase